MPCLLTGGTGDPARVPAAADRRCSAGVPSAVALDGVDVAIPEGGSLGIVGESGSGKSTLVRILLGLDRATSGTVTLPRPADRAGSAAADALVPARGADRPAGPAQLARPADDDRVGHPRAARVPRRARRPRRPDRRGARGGRARSGVADAVPARAVGRPAAARRHRPGHRPGARAARRRRAGQRARRVGAGADPRPAAPARRRVRADARARVPRPRRRQLPVRRRDGAARRGRGRAGSDRPGVRRTRARVHAGAARRRAPAAAA